MAAATQVNPDWRLAICEFAFLKSLRLQAREATFCNLATQSKPDIVKYRYICYCDARYVSHDWTK